MTSDQLQQARAERWAELRPAARTASGLRDWVQAVGFPSAGELAEAFGDATPELLEPELEAATVLELWIWPDELRYASADLVTYLWVSLRPDLARQRSLTPLAEQVFEATWSSAFPPTASELRDRLGAGRTSNLGIERACQELARRFVLLRCGRRQGEPTWQPVLQRFKALREAQLHIQKEEATTAFVSHYLDVRVCDSEEGCAAFLSPLAPRSRVRQALAGLEADRRLLPDSLDGRPAFRLR